MVHFHAHMAIYAVAFLFVSIHVKKIQMNWESCLSLHLYRHHIWIYMLSLVLWCQIYFCCTLVYIPVQTQMPSLHPCLSLDLYRHQIDIRVSSLVFWRHIQYIDVIFMFWWFFLWTLVQMKCNTHSNTHSFTHCNARQHSWCVVVSEEVRTAIAEGWLVQMIGPNIPLQELCGKFVRKLKCCDFFRWHKCVRRVGRGYKVNCHTSVHFW